MLEHVEDDLQVMNEFYRVMRHGGWGIFQVPIDRNNEITIEDKNITDPKDRERLYWQADHVRLYGKDYGKKLASVGFNVIESDYVNNIDNELVKRYALPKGEIIYWCKRD